MTNTNTLPVEISEIDAEMRKLHADAGTRPLNPEQQDRWERLTRQRGILAAAAAGSGSNGSFVPGDRGHDIDARTDDGRTIDGSGTARSTIERAFNAGRLPDYAAERATSLVENGTYGERSLAARWATAAGAPEYRTAFAKMLADPAKGHLLWSGPEAEAYRAVASVQSEMESRTAMSTTGANGGYMIPLTLDPAIMLTNDGSNNPLRQLATVKQTMTNAWQGVTSGGASSEWKGEGSEAADGSPTVGNPSIPVYFGDSFVPYSYEVGLDAVNFLDELAGVLVDSADNLMATAYTTGNGSTAPPGAHHGPRGHRVRDQHAGHRGARSDRPVRPAERAPGSVLGERHLAVPHRNGERVPADGDVEWRAQVPRYARLAGDLAGQAVVREQQHGRSDQRRGRREQLRARLRRHRKSVLHRRPGRRDARADPEPGRWQPAPDRTAGRDPLVPHRLRGRRPAGRTPARHPDIGLDLTVAATARTIAWMFAIGAGGNCGPCRRHGEPTH